MMRGMRAPSDTAPRRRRDARRNRQLLVEAAGEVLREQGLDAPLDEIARRAGVGNATLYRHFPARTELYEAVFAEAAEEVRRIGERVNLIEDGWLALRAYLTEMGEHMAEDRGLCELMVQRIPGSPVLDRLRECSDKVVATVLERAQAQGSVRSDIGLNDVLFMMCALHRVIPASAEVNPHAWRRHLAITLDGLRPRPGSVLPPEGITYEQLLRLAPR
jgi:AcrR family transcriptional regulator